MGLMIEPRDIYLVSQVYFYSQLLCSNNVEYKHRTFQKAKDMTDQL